MKRIFLLSRFWLGVMRARKEWREKRNTPGFTPDYSDLERQIGVEPTLRRYLLYFILPLWMGAGVVDWYHHRKTHIESTAGTHESMIHALMMAETGFPVMIGLFMEVNSLVLLLMIAVFFLHEATAFWDVAYAEELREVTPNEQHTHSFLEVIPFMAVSFMICLHWDQFCALFGIGKAKPDFTLRPKRQPLPLRYINAILLTVSSTVALPYAEEFLRCYRYDKTLSAHHSTTEATTKGEELACR